MLKLLLLLTLSVSYSFAGSREEAQDILERYKNETSHLIRLERMSREFIGLPYGKGGPLGEGPQGKYDQDPLYRFDTFDCTTYVETIMALALARDVNEFENHLDKIRYKDGVVDYFSRNHFTDLQWIPFNIENGYLSELTHTVGTPAEVKTAEALINYPGWVRSHKIEQIVVPLASSEEKKVILEELKSHADEFQTEIARVPYLEIKRIVARPAILNKIPDGTLVNFVRPNWDLTEAAGTHQNISHQGFLFRIKNVLYLRHASTTGKVEQVPFIEYLKRFQNHPTLKGIHLMKIN